MNLAIEIQERASYLDETKQKLVLDIINNFLPYDDEVMPDDLFYIEQAERDLAHGETISHNDIKWK